MNSSVENTNDNLLDHGKGVETVDEEKSVNPGLVEVAEYGGSKSPSIDRVRDSPSSDGFDIAVYPGLLRVSMIFMFLSLAIFLVALDRTIVTTAM